MTKALLRGPVSTLSTDGKINIGYQSDEDGYFMVYLLFYKKHHIKVCCGFNITKNTYRILFLSMFGMFEVHKFQLK